MPIVINATEENVTVQVAGNYFNFKPGQRKTIRSPEIANFIASERRESGLAVLPDLMTIEEENEGEITPEQLAERKAAQAEAEKSALQHALNAYIEHKRYLIKNNQISLAKDLARADYKYKPEVDMSEGEFQAMKLVAKYDSKGKDAAQERLNEIEKLKKKIESK
jgi:hypothetical protein